MTRPLKKHNVKRGPLDEAAETLDKSTFGDFRKEDDADDQDDAGTDEEQDEETANDSDAGTDTQADTQTDEPGENGGEDLPKPLDEAVPVHEDIAPPSQMFTLVAIDVTDDAINACANTPEMVAACQRVVARAQEIEAEKNKPAPLSVDDMAAANYQRLEKQYGKDFVTAVKGTNQTYFSRITWNDMGANHGGWKVKNETMPETEADTEAAE